MQQSKNITIAEPGWTTHSKVMVVSLACEIMGDFSFMYSNFLFILFRPFNCKWHQFNLTQLKEKAFIGFYTVQVQGLDQLQVRLDPRTQRMVPGLWLSISCLWLHSQTSSAHMGATRSPAMLTWSLILGIPGKCPGKSVIVPECFTCPLLGRWPAECHILIGHTWVTWVCVCVLGRGRVNSI